MNYQLTTLKCFIMWMIACVVLGAVLVLLPYKLNHYNVTVDYSSGDIDDIESVTMPLEDYLSMKSELDAIRKCRRACGR